MLAEEGNRTAPTEPHSPMAKETLPGLMPATPHENPLPPSLRIRLSKHLWLLVWAQEPHLLCMLRPQRQRAAPPVVPQLVVLGVLVRHAPRQRVLCLRMHLHAPQGLHSAAGKLPPWLTEPTATPLRDAAAAALRIPRRRRASGPPPRLPLHSTQLTKAVRVGMPLQVARAMRLASPHPPWAPRQPALPLPTPHQRASGLPCQAAGTTQAAPRAPGDTASATPRPSRWPAPALERARAVRSIVRHRSQ